MICAVGLLIAPGAFHQLAEGGSDSRRVVQYTNRIASLAMLPFAVGIGIDVYIATQVVLGAPPALSAGIAASAFALMSWYGIEWTLRLSGRRQEERNVQDESETDLSTRIRHVLTEARVVLPGAQALLGFQFAAVLTEAFEKLPKMSQYVHLASLGLIAVCIVLLMAPAAYHRIVERGEDTNRVHTFSSVMVVCALIPLALGISGDVYVVLVKVLQSTTAALALSGISLMFFYVLWFGVTLALRRRRAERRGSSVPVGETRAA